MNLKESAAMDIQDIIGYHFHDTSLLVEALSHTSYTNERKINKIKSYQRLEFLGDAVLELVTSRYLFERFPDYSEGELTKTRASIVCEEALAACAGAIDLGKYILLGVGESMNHGERKPSILCDVMEAIIGAIFIDDGYESASAFIDKYILSRGVSTEKDMKTALQEAVQAVSHDKRIVYEVINSTGPEHLRNYEVKVLIGGEEFGRGIGNSKKEAEMKAAAEALNKLG